MNLVMHSLRQKHGMAPKKTIVPFIFRCVASEARSVHVVGDFNDWDPKAHPMRRHVDGSWSIQVRLDHGHHQYQFLVDGKPVLDPRAHGVVRNERNERVSLVCVS